MAEVALVPLLQKFFGHLLQGQIPPILLVKILVSKALGYAILLGSCFVKLPQVLVVWKNKSAEGLNVLSYELDVLGLTIHSSYGFLKGLPASAYGEAVVLLLESFLLLHLVYHYSKTVGKLRPAVVTVSWFGALWAVGAGYVSTTQIARAFELNNYIFTAARVPQIIQNYRSKSTGQLALPTYAFNFVGCLARIFTSIQEGAGSSMVRAFMLGATLNLTLVLQILAYRKKPAKATKAD